MTKVELRRKNDRLRDKIDQILEQHPELRDVTEVIAFREGGRALPLRNGPDARSRKLALRAVLSVK